MDRVLASRQRWIGQTASIDALNSDIGADRDFGLHRDTSAPRPDEGRGGSSHTTNSSPEANMVEVGNGEAFVTLLATGTVSQHRINGVLRISLHGQGAGHSSRLHNSELPMNLAFKGRDMPKQSRGCPACALT